MKYTVKLALFAAVAYSTLAVTGNMKTRLG